MSSLCIQILLPSMYFPNVMKLGCKYFVSTIWTCVFMYLFYNCKYVTLVRRPHVRRPHVRRPHVRRSHLKQRLPESGSLFQVGKYSMIQRKCFPLNLNLGFIEMINRYFLALKQCHVCLFIFLIFYAFQLIRV